MVATAFYLGIGLGLYLAQMLSASPVITENDTLLVQNKCLKESKIDAELFLTILLTGDNMDDVTFKKFVDCTYREHGFIGNDRKINKELIRQYNKIFHTEEFTDELLGSCENLSKNVDDLALEHYKCLARKKKELAKKVKSNEV